MVDFYPQKPLKNRPRVGGVRKRIRGATAVGVICPMEVACIVDLFLGILCALSAYVYCLVIKWIYYVGLLHLFILMTVWCYPILFCD